MVYSVVHRIRNQATARFGFVSRGGPGTHSNRGTSPGPAESPPPTHSTHSSLAPTQYTRTDKIRRQRRHPSQALAQYGSTRFVRLTRQRPPARPAVNSAQFTAIASRSSTRVEGQNVRSLHALNCGCICLSLSRHTLVTPKYARNVELQSVTYSTLLRGLSSCCWGLFALFLPMKKKFS